MFKSLQLKTEVAKQYTTGEEDNSLNNLSRINIFIGPNNTGKSRFMRDLFNVEQHLFDKEPLQLNKYDEKLCELKEYLQDKLKTLIHNDELDLEILNSECFNNEESIKILIKEIETYQELVQTKINSIISKNYSSRNFQLIRLKLNEELPKLINILKESYKLQHK